MPNAPYIEISNAPMDVAQAAEFLGMPESSIYYYTSKNKIPFFKPVKKLFFFQWDLINWIKKFPQGKFSPSKP